MTTFEAKFKNIVIKYLPCINTKKEVNELSDLYYALNKVYEKPEMDEFNKILFSEENKKLCKDTFNVVPLNNVFEYFHKKVKNIPDKQKDTKCLDTFDLATTFLTTLHERYHKFTLDFFINLEEIKNFKDSNRFLYIFSPEQHIIIMALNLDFNKVDKKKLNFKNFNNIKSGCSSIDEFFNDSVNYFQSDKITNYPKDYDTWRNIYEMEQELIRQFYISNSNDIAKKDLSMDLENILVYLKFDQYNKQLLDETIRELEKIRTTMKPKSFSSIESDEEPEEEPEESEEENTDDIEDLAVKLQNERFIEDVREFITSLDKKIDIKDYKRTIFEHIDEKIDELPNDCLPLYSKEKLNKKEERKKKQCDDFIYKKDLKEIQSDIEILEGPSYKKYIEGLLNESRREKEEHESKIRIETELTYNMERINTSIKEEEGKSQPNNEKIKILKSKLFSLEGQERILIDSKNPSDYYTNLIQKILEKDGDITDGEKTFINSLKSKLSKSNQNILQSNEKVRILEEALEKIKVHVSKLEEIRKTIKIVVSFQAGVRNILRIRKEEREEEERKERMKREEVQRRIREAREEEKRRKLAIEEERRREKEERRKLEEERRRQKEIEDFTERFAKARLQRGLVKVWRAYRDDKKKKIILNTKEIKEFKSKVNKYAKNLKNLYNRISVIGKKIQSSTISANLKERFKKQKIKLIDGNDVCKEDFYTQSATYKNFFEYLKTMKVTENDSKDIQEEIRKCKYIINTIDNVNIDFEDVTGIGRVLIRIRPAVRKGELKNNIIASIDPDNNKEVIYYGNESSIKCHFNKRKLSDINERQHRPYIKRLLDTFFPDGKKGKKTISYGPFTKVYTSKQNNSSIYKDGLEQGIAISSTVQRMFSARDTDDMYNILIFSFGQSGSGKSFTLLGDEELNLKIRKVQKSDKSDEDKNARIKKLREDGEGIAILSLRDILRDKSIMEKVDNIYINSVQLYKHDIYDALNGKEGKTYKIEGISYNDFKKKFDNKNADIFKTTGEFKEDGVHYIQKWDSNFDIGGNDKNPITNIEKLMTKVDVVKKFQGKYEGNREDTIFQKKISALNGKNILPGPGSTLNELARNQYDFYPTFNLPFDNLPKPFDNYYTKNVVSFDDMDKVMEDCERKTIYDSKKKQNEEKVVKTMESIIDKIKKNRPTRTTFLNPSSSRSHLFIILNIVLKDEYDNKKILLTFSDLAGIEDPKDYLLSSRSEGEYLVDTLKQGRDFDNILSSYSKGIVPKPEIDVTRDDRKYGLYNVVNYLTNDFDGTKKDNINSPTKILTFINTPCCLMENKQFLKNEKTCMNVAQTLDFAEMVSGRKSAIVDDLESL